MNAGAGVAQGVDAGRAVDAVAARGLGVGEAAGRGTAAAATLEAGVAAATATGEAATAAAGVGVGIGDAVAVADGAAVAAGVGVMIAAGGGCEGSSPPSQASVSRANSATSPAQRRASREAVRLLPSCASATAILRCAPGLADEWRTPGRAGRFPAVAERDAGRRDRYSSISPPSTPSSTPST